MKKTCACGATYDPRKDLFITVNERKGPSIDFCSMACASAYLEWNI